MKPPISCHLCRSEKYLLLYKDSSCHDSAKNGYRISESHLLKPKAVVRCAGCRLVYALPEMASPSLVQDYAQMEDPAYLEEEKGRLRQAKEILSQILRFRNHGRLLDIGCGPGFFLEEAKSAGFEATGVDYSAWGARYARNHFGISVFEGSLEEARFEDQSFDVIVLMDLIEHLENPRALLKEIRRVLKHDGIIYLSTPDIGSFFSKILGVRWWGIHRHHLFYFSRKTLETLLAQEGFRARQYFSYPRIFSVRYWVKRLESYPVFIRKIFSFLFGWDRNPGRLLKITLHDELAVVAGKIQRLDSIASDAQASAPCSRALKVTAVLPAYNAEKTLERTVADIPKETINEIILVDDASADRTVAIAERLGLVVFRHPKNLGYGANQKTCYQKALLRGADIVVMVHPDYQYDPKIIPQLIEPIQQGRADAVFGSRMMKGGALEGGMPLWKHNANILLTAFANVMLGTYLTEYHSGFRAYSARLLKEIPYQSNPDGFLFDTQIIVQILDKGFKIEEIPIRTRYFEEASSIRFWPSVRYGLGFVWIMFTHALGFGR
jgi:SAM-dependent methyltransferase